MGAKLTIGGDNKTKAMFRAIDKALDKTKRVALAVTGAMARGFGGVVRRLGSVKSMLVGGAITAGLAKSVMDANAFANAMGQVDTMLSDTTSIKGMTMAVRDLSAETGIAANELAEGLYQALSAGVPPDNAIAFLSTASAGAVAGATSVTESVDILTTVLNAFKLDASQTTRVSDLLFQTVAKGKTTLGELSGSLAQVAPLAASSGIEIEQVAGAITTLTKMGTPTKQAVTQIRAAILATNEVMGDGWAATMSMQDGFKAVSDKAGGSQTKLRALVGSVEALNGILGTTGDNAKGAAADLKAISESAGAMEAANRKMQVARAWAKLFMSVKAGVLAVGGAINTGLRPLVEALAAKFRDLARRAGPLDGLADRIKAMSEKVVGNLDNIFARIAKGAQTVMAVVKALADADTRGKTLGKLGAVVIAMFSDAATAMINLLVAAAPIIGEAIGGAIQDTFIHRIEAARKEGALRGQAASAAEANGTTMEQELAAARKRQIAGIAKGLAPAISQTTFALKGLAESVEGERRKIAKAMKDLAKVTQQTADKMPGAQGGKADLLANGVQLKDIIDGKIDIGDLDPTQVSVFDGKQIVGSVASFMQAVVKKPSFKAMHLQKFGLTKDSSGVQRMGAPGVASKLGFGRGAGLGGASRFGNINRLEARDPFKRFLPDMAPEAQVEKKVKEIGDAGRPAHVVIDKFAEDMVS